MFARDESFGEPAMNRGRSNLEDLRSAGDCYQLAFRGFCWRLEARDVAIPTQAPNLVCGETLTADGFASLTIENAGNDSVRVMNGQASNQFDGVFVGAYARRDLGEANERSSSVIMPPRQRSVR